MRVELKNVRISEHLSEETTAFTATLWIDGKKAADCRNTGQGGPTNYHFKDRTLQQRFEAWAKALPPHTYPETPHMKAFTVPMDGEHLIDLLLERHRDEKLCKNKTTFQLKSKPGVWHLSSKPFSPEMKAYLLKQYGDDLGEILNESLANGQKDIPGVHTPAAGAAVTS